MVATVAKLLAKTTVAGSLAASIVPLVSSEASVVGGAAATTAVVKSVISLAVCVCADGVNVAGLPVMSFHVEAPDAPGGPCGPVGPTPPVAAVLTVVLDTAADTPPFATATLTPVPVTDAVMSLTAPPPRNRRGTFAWLFPIRRRASSGRCQRRGPRSVCRSTPRSASRSQLR